MAAPPAKRPVQVISPLLVAVEVDAEERMLRARAAHPGEHAQPVVGQSFVYDESDGDVQSVHQVVKNCGRCPALTCRNRTSAAQHGSVQSR